MVPAAYTGDTVDKIAAALGEGDIIIDGGNSYYHDDIDRAAALKPRGIHYVDVGTSGGVFGLERGYCLMIGGEDDRRPPGPALPRPSRPASRPRPAPTVATGRRRPPNRATSTVAPTAPATSSRWSTTASSTGSWPPTPRASTSCTRPTSARPSRRGRRRDHPPLESRVLPVRHRHRRGGRAVAAGERRLVLAARPDRPRPARRPEAGRVCRSGVGLG